MNSHLFGLLLFGFIAQIWAQNLSNSTCTNVACCRQLANPNPSTGDGYLNFDGQCLSATEALHCVDKTGCLLCHNGNVSVNAFNRPLCGVGAVFPLPSCSDQSCCNSIMSPNTATGYGYLEFTQSCLSGGSNCADKSGCLDCFNPSVTSAANSLGRPVCSTSAINSFNLASVGAQTTQALATSQAQTSQAQTSQAQTSQAQTTLATTEVPVVVTTEVPTTQLPVVTVPVVVTTQVPVVQTTEVPVVVTTQVPVVQTTEVPVVTVPVIQTTQVPIFTQQQVSTIIAPTLATSAASVAVPALFAVIIAALLL